MPSLPRLLRVFVPPIATFALLGGSLVLLGVPLLYTVAALALLVVGIVGGVGHTPYSRWAVGRRGRVTDDEVVRHVPCGECGRDAVRGLRRTYRRELVLFGTPVWTIGTGENVYCRACTGGTGEAGGRRSAERGVAETEV